ncbi:alpha DNA polymerase [Ephemerocybe angulata]|uniref:DNA polymerase alpha subunit B n=1 Tax=Ephemerocybe angulata TaxID=980116 RepID=A0A8H6I512_9AGAR|nr:alpha DNA polymerase [Tulosesus angulatus]
MDSKLRDELEAILQQTLPLEDAVLTECVSICNIYHITPTDLKYKLEAMNYKASNTGTEIMPITIETLNAFKAQTQRNMARETTKKAQLKARGGATTANVNRARLPAQLMNQGRAMDVDAGPSGSSTAATPVKKEPVAITLNLAPSHVVFQGAKMDAESKKRRGYRYMYEKISERSEVLDQTIDDFADLIKDQFDIEELADPSAGTDEEVTIVGRIWQDPDVSSNSKLTEGSLWIESSRMLSSGARIPLRLDSAIKVKGVVAGSGGYGLFPGQIVALQGKNGGGGYFHASAILAIPPLKPSPTAQGVRDPKADPSIGEKDSTVCILSGPYTPDSDLLFKPWRAFLKTAIEAPEAKKPHVLILIGPFIDISHPKIQNGETDASPSSIFRARFLDPLRKFLQGSPSSIVVLVPSVRDILSRHCVFPQSEFEAELTDSHPRIFLQPNPARFTIDDISFGVTSVDVLFHLRKEEYFKRGVELAPIPATPGEVPSDTMANLCRHMLNQRSFYPYLCHDVNLDVSHLDEARMIDDGDVDYAPDVLIVPSRLKKFEKVVSSTLAINPSFLSKSSYAVLNIAKRTESSTLRERLQAELVTLDLPAAPAPAPTAVPPPAPKPEPSA